MRVELDEIWKQVCPKLGEGLIESLEGKVSEKWNSGGWTLFYKDFKSMPNR